MRRLIIAEKPSVARDLASVLGVTGRTDGALTSNEWVITWCFGHLVELVEPKDYDPSWEAWSLSNLPMIPDTFRLRATSDGADQFAKVSAWLHDSSISGVVNACDAGREGELIFGYVYELSGSTLPVERLWIASLTEAAISEGMSKLQPGRAFAPLMAAAKARSEADWLIGLNATRCATLAARGADPNARIPLISIGRVQTPTLGLLAARTKERADFTPRTYHTLTATFLTPDDARFEGVLVEDESATNALRHFEKARADDVLAQMTGAKGARVGVLERKEKKKGAPGFFDLTSLQQAANKRHGFTAKQTLEHAQALYEKHKLLTYPRTDSKHITPDMAATLPGRLTAALRLPALSPLAGSLSVDTAELGKRLVNADKVTDHHAILPTDVDPTTVALTDDEAAIYELVARRLCAAVSPPALIASTRVITHLLGRAYLTRGTQTLTPGWRVFEGKESKDEEGDASVDDSVIPASLQQGMDVALEQARLNEETTKPPSAYTEATLLGAMERAGASLDEAELQRVMKGSGLGTPATRADTIETLLRRTYVERKGKSIVATELGLQVIDALSAFPHLTSAQLTGRWEAALSQVADGALESSVFMGKVKEMTRELVRHFTANPPRIQGVERETLCGCPACGTRQVLISDKGVWCQGLRGGECDFRLARTLCKKKLTPGQLTTLLTQGTLPEVKGFTAKSGKKFAAPLKLERTDERGWGISFDFPVHTPEDFSGAPPVGACPKCGGQVVLGERSAKCTTDGCDVRLWRQVCGVTLSPEVVATLLSSRVTTRISGFRSKKGKSFSTNLVLAENELGWRIGFPPREEGSKGGKKKRRR